MMGKNKYKWLAFFTAFVYLFLISCENREWDNPFDPDCPKELFTPSDFKAVQEGTQVKLTWSQFNNQISGFVIERSVDGGAMWTSVATPSKTELTWSDSNLPGGKEYKYRLTARAGSNSSNYVSSQLRVSFVMNIPGPNVTDIDGNTYKSVKIGNQVWMAENLKTTKYRDGTLIPNVTDATAWTNLSTGAYCYFSNSSANGAVYGGLYNFFAVVDNRGICPIGWHIPSDTEWMTLRDYLGGENIAGGKLKETGTTHWSSANSGVDNSSGFTAFAGSWRGGDGNFYYNVRTAGWWWTSTSVSATDAWFYYIGDNSIQLLRSSTDPYFHKKAGCSVRCIKD